MDGNQRNNLQNTRFSQMDLRLRIQNRTLYKYGSINVLRNMLLLTNTVLPSNWKYN